MNRSSCVLVRALASALFLALTVLPAFAQTTATGIIEGRVFNETSGTFLQNARVTLENSNRDAFTDQFGFYRLAEVPAGTVRLKVFYTGLPQQESTLDVTAAEPGTYNYRPQATFIDGNIEFRITKHLAVYGTVRNLSNDYRPDERYGPSSPAYSYLRTVGDQRRQFTVGMRGTF